MMATISLQLSCLSLLSAILTSISQFISEEKGVLVIIIALAMLIIFILLIHNIFSSPRDYNNDSVKRSLEDQSATNYVVVKRYKSTGTAMLLAMFFGPIGLFYSSITGGFIMSLTPVVLIVAFLVGGVTDNAFLLGLSFLFFIVFCATYWVICIIWAVIAVSQYNKNLSR